MLVRNTRIWLLAFIMVVNALSYATIIPLLYPYAATFGIKPFGMSLLVAAYSLAQFLATPILGRLSDRYGRKPLLLLCILGTAISLGMFAMATNFLVMLIARFLDGITGGNISIAHAIISDSTTGEERAKSFGVLLAAFSFGFVVGPAIGGKMSVMYGLTSPFWFSAALAIVAVVLGFFLLPETLQKSSQKINLREPLFKFNAIYHALFSPATGILLLISFLSATGFNAMILAFQAYVNDVLHLSLDQISLFFTVFGLIGIFMQIVGISLVLKITKSKKKVLFFSFLFSILVMVMAPFNTVLWPFFFVMMAFSVVSSFRDPMVNSLLTERTNKEDQGGILGINQSYVSLGQIVGPLAAGYVAEISIPYAFFATAGFFALALISMRWLGKHVQPKMDL